jgi:serine protease inhibitor
MRIGRSLHKSIEEAMQLWPDYSTSFSNVALSTLLLNAEDGNNIVVSPARLQAVLVMLANCASPTIRKRILECMGSDIMTLKEANILSSKSLLDAAHSDHFEEDGEEHVSPTIEQQAILWAKNGLEVDGEEVAKLAENFSLMLKRVDFSEEAKSIIDKTIEEATHGLIKSLHIEFDKDTLALITDILYFKATWEERFEESKTREQLFYGINGKNKVPMMKRTSFMEYAELGSCQIAVLPYQCYSEDRRFSLRIFLPKPRHTIQNVLTEVRDNGYSLDTNELEVRLTLPRFSVESNIKMKDLLKRLGLSCIFTSNDIIPKLIKGLKINNIYQQAKVDVDENGTEAAVVTYAVMVGGLPQMEMQKPVVMTVNRPFMFEIAEETTNTILFAGVINDIEQ